MQECTFKPKLYWGRKLGRKRRTTTASPNENVSSNDTFVTPRGHRSLSPRRKLLFEPLSPRRRAVPPPMKPRSLLTSLPRDPIPIPTIPPPPRDTIPTITLSPIDFEDEADSHCDSLSLLRKHHDIMRERNQRPDSPVPPLPLEIITTGVPPLSSVVHHPWKTALYSRGGSISPLRDKTLLGIEIGAEEDQRTTMAPRIVFCGTTVGGGSETAQTQATEYGSI